MPINPVRNLHTQQSAEHSTSNARYFSSNGEKENNCIEIENISFSYNGNPVLENINFTVKNGDYIGVIGPNGGGKTTLIKIILGLLHPDSGAVKIFGVQIKTFKEKALIGYVPQRTSQNVNQFPATVEEIVKSGRTPRVGILKRFNKEDIIAIKNAMEVADVMKYKTKLLSDLSGGERQKVYIARALAGEPKILILDEPSIGIDLSAQEKFYAFIKKLNKNYGLTIIFVSHDIAIVAREVKRLLCLNKNLICHGKPKEFINKKHLEKIYGKKVNFIFHEH